MRMNGGLSFHPVAEGIFLWSMTSLFLEKKKGMPFDIFLCVPPLGLNTSAGTRRFNLIRRFSYNVSLLDQRGRCCRLRWMEAFLPPDDATCFFLSETLQAERKLNGLMIKNKIFCPGGGYRDTSSS